MSKWMVRQKRPNTNKKTTTKEFQIEWDENCTVQGQQGVPEKYPQEI
jgi:hypothetical protein